jgi:hypothetical protein
LKRRLPLCNADFLMWGNNSDDPKTKDNIWKNRNICTPEEKLDFGTRLLAMAKNDADKQEAQWWIDQSRMQSKLANETTLALDTIVQQQKKR